MPREDVEYKNWLMLKLKSLPPDKMADILLTVAYKSNTTFLSRCMIERNIIKPLQYQNETGTGAK